ncbi:MAG: FlgD immunoglobulin-like domain containing protein [Candidatus Krumholzibacteriia bacterium]
MCARSAFFGAALAGLALLLAPVLAEAQDCFDYRDQGYRVVGTFGTGGLRLARDGALLAAATGAGGVLLYDLTDPYDPQAVGGVAGGQRVYGLALRDGVLAATGPDLGLALYDLAVPGAPVAGGSRADVLAGAPALAPGHVLFAAGDTALAVMAVGPGLELTPVGELVFGEPVLAIVVDGPLAYCTVGEDLLAVVSWQDAGGPTLVGSWMSGNGCRALALQGDRLLVSTDSPAVFVVDVADPALPVMTAFFTGPVLAEVLVWTGTTAVTVAASLPPVTVVDLAEPDAPRVEAIVPSPGRALAAVGDVVYVGRQDEIGILDLGDRTLPEMVELPEVTDAASAWVMLDGLTATVDREHGLNVFDGATGALVLNLPIPGYGRLAGDGRRVIMHDPDQPQVQLIGLQDPLHPQLQMLDPLPEGDITAATVAGDRAALVVEQRYVQTYVLSGAAAVGGSIAFEIGPPVSSPVWLGDHLLLGGGGSLLAGLSLFDCSRLSALALRDWIALPKFGALDVAAHTTTAYVSTFDDGVHVIDVSDRDRMVNVGTFGGHELSGAKLEVQDDILYAQTRGGILHVYDLRIPTAPGFVATTVTASYRRSMLAVGADGILLDVFGRLTLQPLQCALGPMAGVPAAVPVALAVTPNPFNPRTELRFTLDREQAVTVAVFDLAGRRVRTLADGRVLAAGPQTLAWDGRDEQGRAAPSGVYLARVTAGGARLDAKMTLLR